MTYFFAGGEEQPEPGEQREVVPSPRDVPTYDHKPEMSAGGVAKASSTTGWRRSRLRRHQLRQRRHGRSHRLDPAATTAVEFVDARLGEIIEAVTSTGGAVIVTADHGNADEMLEEDGSPDTAHSLNPVPLVIVGDGITLAGDSETVALSGPGVTDAVQTTGRTGALCDVAPTVLALLGFTQPPR